MTSLDDWLTEAPPAPGGDAPPAGKLDEWVNAGPAPAERPGFLRGMAGSIANGAMLGFADEARAGIRGLGAKITGGEFGSTYDAELARSRASQKAFAEDHPVASTVGGLYGGGGAALLSAPISTAVRGTALATRLAASLPELPALASLPGGALASRLLGSTAGRGIAAGASGGAVQGFGEGEGGVGSRLGSAAVGGGVGAVAGPVLSLGANAVGRVGGRIADVSGLRNPETAADRLILRSLERDRLTPADLQARAGQAIPDNILPDLGGRNLTGLAAVASRVPGEAMDVAHGVTELRRGAAPDRMAAASDAAFGGGSGGDVAAARDALMMERSRAAGPLYDQAFAAPIQPNADLARMMEHPIVEDGLARGLRIQRLEAAASGTPAPHSDTRTLDAVKRGLDDRLEQYRDPTTGRLNLDQEGRAIEQFRQQFVASVDRANPLYAQARQAWAGPSAAMDAMGRGRDALKVDRDVLERTFGGMSQADQEFFRLGVGRAVTDASSDPASAAGVARKLLENRQMQARLETTIPDPAQRQAFTEALEREVRMNATNRAVAPNSGSPTAMLQAGMVDMAQDPPGGWLLGLLNAARSGGITGAGARGLEMLYRRGQGINSSSADALAQRLFAQGPAAMQQTIQGLTARRAADLSATEVQQALANRLLLGAGATAGSVATPQN